MKRFICISLFLVVTTLCLTAAAPTSAEQMAAAASKLLGTLSTEQTAKAVYELKSDVRTAWHFIPSEMLTGGSRKGLPFKDMSAAQRKLVHDLLKTILSERGQAKVNGIISLEDILREMEGAKARVKRDPELYFISIYGKPEAKGTWAWRFEGHHLSLNYLIVEGREIAVTPTFMGSNPGEVRTGSRKGTRVLAAEEDLGRALAKSLNPDQLKTAVFSAEAPKDIITAADRKAKQLSPAGISATEMNKEQRGMLAKLINEYLTRHRAEQADKDWQKIETAGVDKISFAWAGSIELGKGHYYRVQGPTFLLEYDNTQNEANHVHAVWRDFENDFGDDILRRHYDQAHPKK